MLISGLALALVLLRTASAEGATAWPLRPSGAGTTLNAQGQAALTGRIVDALTGTAVADAVVHAGGSEARTSADGGYRLALPPGRYDVRVAAVGYVGMALPGEVVTQAGLTRNVAMVREDLSAAEQTQARERLRAEAGADDAATKVDLPSAVAVPGVTTTPATIRVQMPDGSIVTLATDDYLKGVVPFEIGPGSPAEAQKAQAVAARTYAATHCLPASAGDPARCEPGIDANVDTTTRTQVWRASPRYDSSNQAVDATSNVVLRQGDNLATATLYFGHTVLATRNNEDVFNGPPYSYLRSVASPDPFDQRYGHGVGMSQVGAMVLASWGAGYADILRHYYTGLAVEAAPPPATAAAIGAAPVAAHGGVPPQQATPAPTMQRKDVTIAGNGWAQGTSSGATPGGKLEATSSGPVTYTSAPQAAGFEFKALAVAWGPALPEGATIAVEVRVSDDGVTWQPWRAAPPADAARDSVAPSGTDLLLEQGRVAQVRVTLDQGLARTPPSLTELTLHFLRPENLPTPTEVIAAANAAKAAGGDALKPPIVPRSAYGVSDAYVEWDDCWRGASSDRQGYMKPQAFAVHHTADNRTSLTGPEWAYTVWYYHTYTKGWGDTGYHYMVDRDGIVYQGRTPGTASPPYMVEGGHVYGYNCSSGGVVALGNYQPGIDVPLTPLTDQTLQGLSKVLAWLMDSYGWRPWDSRVVKGITVTGLAGHRDFGGTVCPGQDLYDRLPELRDRVEALLDSEPSPTATPTAPVSATATPRPRDPTPPPPGPTPTLGAGCRDVIRQGDFGLYDQWDMSGVSALASTFSYQSPPRSLFLGHNQAQADPAGWAMATQRNISIPQPVERARLSFWYAPFADGADGDIHRVELQDAAGNTLPGGWLMNQQPPQNTRDWTLFQADVTDALRAADGDMTLVFSVYNDGNGLKTYMRIDDVVLEVCGGATPTPSRTPTATPTRTPRPTATPLPVACTDWTRNGGFEAGDLLPQGWALQDGGVDVALASDNHTPGGARSLHLGRTTAGGTMGYAAAWQDFTWPSGVTAATLRFAYKAQGGDGGDRRLVEARDVTTGERVTLWTLDGAQDTGWQTIELPVTMQPVGHAAQVYFALLDQGGANAEILIDDVSLELCGRGLGGPWRMYLPAIQSGGGGG